MYYVPVKVKTVVLIFLAIFLGCSGTLPENGEVKVGQQFSVVLETSWQDHTRWNLTDYDKEMVEFIKSDRQGGLDPNSMGGRSSNTFFFKALKAGETDLKFNLEKIWGTGDYGRAVRHIVIK